MHEICEYRGKWFSARNKFYYQITLKHPWVCLKIAMKCDVSTISDDFKHIEKCSQSPQDYM